MVLPWFCRRSSGLERDRNLVVSLERAPSRSAVQRPYPIDRVVFVSRPGPHGNDRHGATTSVGELSAGREQPGHFEVLLGSLTTTRPIVPQNYSPARIRFIAAARINPIFCYQCYLRDRYGRLAFRN